MERKSDLYLGKQIKIIKCWTIGHEYNKLYPNTIHTVVTPREGERNGDEGVWVKGVHEPVKVFFDEFTFLKQITRK
jgi:hypothetical protein